jgi:alpha-glucosidase
MLLLLAALTLTSPDGLLRLSVEPNGYRLDYRGRAILEPSRLPALRVVRTARAAHDESWKPVYGERSLIRDRYRALTIFFEGGRQVEFRLANEGLAFRWHGGAEEQTEFALPAGTFAWEEHGTEGEYARVPVERIQPECERPLTLEYAHGAYAAITEAGLVDYPRMLVSPAGGRTLKVALSGPARAAQTPWRVVLVGDRPGDLLERNFLILNLSAPNALKDTSWIRPGKAIREVTLSTKGGKECVDFAVKQRLQYVEYDAGWYGYEYDDASDASHVSLDPRRVSSIPNHGGLDLPEVIRYAKGRGIEVLLYVNRRALERQLDTILPLYRSWGVAGVKFGFVQVGPQEWTKWLHDAVAKAAEQKLVVDIHDNYRPTGFSRTYPNLLTQEGIRGNEHMPTAAHNTTLPFTRYLAGAGDYTVCYYTPRLKTTRAHQLALPVVFYSPLHFFFWYDKPSDSDEGPELEFFREVPTVWDETKVLDGRIGEFASVARRSGERWFIGTITGDAPRRLELPLTFLGGGPYRARIFENGPGGVRIRDEQVTGQSRLVADLPAAGGQAVILQK